MTLEELSKRLSVRQKKIDELNMEQQQDLQALNNPDMLDADLVSIKKICQIYGVSWKHVYDMIDRGLLHRRDNGGVIHVSRKEYESIDDRKSGRRNA